MEPLWESETCSQEELDDKEIELIKKWNTLHPNGYNLTEGGCGGRHSEITKAKLSEKSKTFWKNKRDEMVEKRRKQWTEERKIKVSVTLKQRYIDHPEMRIKKLSTSIASRSSCM